MSISIDVLGSLPLTQGKTLLMATKPTVVHAMINEKIHRFSVAQGTIALIWQR